LNQNENKSLFIRLFQIISDILTIFKSEIELAKNNLTYSAKKLGLGISLLVISLFLTLLFFLFILISIAFIFVELGLYIWLAFLLVAVIMLGISTIFALLGFRSFKKIKGISDASRIGSETKKYLSENIGNFRT